MLGSRPPHPPPPQWTQVPEKAVLLLPELTEEAREGKVEPVVGTVLGWLGRSSTAVLMAASLTESILLLSMWCWILGMMKASVSHSAAVSAPGLADTGELPCTCTPHVVLWRWTVAVRVLVGVVTEKASLMSFTMPAWSLVKTGGAGRVMTKPLTFLLKPEVRQEKAGLTVEA